MSPKWLALAVAIALLLGAAAWVLGRHFASSAVPHSTSQVGHPSVSRLRATVPPGFVMVRDRQGIFSVAYPSSWRRMHAADPQVIVLATGPDGASLLVRQTPLTGPVSTGNLAAAKQLADRVVRSGNGVSLLRAPQRVTLGGLPGYLYLYTFKDPASGRPGAHAHYFLFDGPIMVTLVFQALPAPRILSLDHLFDRIASTFHLISG